VRCEAKVVRKEGEPRVVRGKVFVTRDVSATADVDESWQRAALIPVSFSVIQLLPQYNCYANGTRKCVVCHMAGWRWPRQHG
jgi:hypothetical protein